MKTFQKTSATRRRQLKMVSACKPAGANLKLFVKTQPTPKATQPLETRGPDPKSPKPSASVFFLLSPTIPPTSKETQPAAADHLSLPQPHRRPPSSPSLPSPRPWRPCRQEEPKTLAPAMATREIEHSRHGRGRLFHLRAVLLLYTPWTCLLCCFSGRHGPPSSGSPRSSSSSRIPSV